MEIATETLKNYSEQLAEDSDHCRIVMLGYIRGLSDFANCMKEVLKA